MILTKKNLIEMAFEEIGMPLYTYPLTAEQFSSTLRKLDTMMAGWNSDGIRVGYNLPERPEDSNISESVNVPDRAISAIYLNLSIKIAPIFGKAVSPELTKNANSSYKSLSRSTTEIQSMKMQGLPSGAGNKSWRYDNNSSFINEEFQQKDLEVGRDGDLELF